ncbi:hypothetical protein JB92DRAFT_1872962 [Gautieria morchelliformis]|nr:hypothetical protein JB92DRAFT_1872962 [Gautieria morchelliformis]
MNVGTHQERSTSLADVCVCTLSTNACAGAGHTRVRCDPQWPPARCCSPCSTKPAVPPHLTCRCSPRTLDKPGAMCPPRDLRQLPGVPAAHRVISGDETRPASSSWIPVRCVRINDHSAAQLTMGERRPETPPDSHAATNSALPQKQGQVVHIVRCARILPFETAGAAGALETVPEDHWTSNDVDLNLVLDWSRLEHSRSNVSN